MRQRLGQAHRHSANPRPSDPRRLRVIPVRGFEGRSRRVRPGPHGLAAARALAAGGAEVVVWDEGRRPRRRGGGRLRAGGPARADWSSFAALVLSPGVPLTHPEAALDGREGPGRRRRDHRRHRALRPHRRRRPGAQAAQDRRHHRHQRQVDHHRPDRPRLPPGRPRRAHRRQHRRRRAGPGGHARRRGLRAGAVVLPARPDLEPEARRRHHPQHLARPPGPARRHGRLCRRQAAHPAEPGQGRHRRDRRRRPLVPADLHRDHRRQPAHHRADQRPPRDGPRRLRPAGHALRRHRRARDRDRRPDPRRARCRAATTGRTRPPPTPRPARSASPSRGRRARA